MKELIFLSRVSSSKLYALPSLRYRVAMNNRRYAICTMVVSHVGEVRKTPSENLLRSGSHARPASLHNSRLCCLRFFFSFFPGRFKVLLILLCRQIECKTFFFPPLPSCGTDRLKVCKLSCGAELFSVLTGSALTSPISSSLRETPNSFVGSARRVLLSPGRRRNHPGPPHLLPT